MESDKPKPSFHERLAAAREKAAKDPFWHLSGVVAARARLRELFANAGEPSLSPDWITDAAEQAGIFFEFVLIRNPWRADPAGIGSVSFDEMPDLDIFDLVFADHRPTPGPLWFIPDQCFSQRQEPHMVLGEELRDFVESLRCPLNDDALFIWRESPRVSLIHHEGAFTHIFLPTASE